MSWRNAARSLRILAALGSAALLASCFQPLYGETSINGDSSIKTSLSGVDVAQIEATNGTPTAHMAVDVRNQLVFLLQGGGGGPPPTHRLTVRLVPTRSSVIVDLRSSRPDAELFGLNATYTLVDLKTGRQVLSGSTFARATYDIPGQEQRFARQRGQLDAEKRASEVIAENIRNRLASYFVAGT
jgi:LPS-assembly lipoprotein